MENEMINQLARVGATAMASYYENIKSMGKKPTAVEIRSAGYSKDETVRRTLIKLVQDGHISVTGKITNQDVLDWLARQEEPKQGRDHDDTVEAVTSNNQGMKHYNIWMEGFSMTGASDSARFVGTFEADSFKEACQKAFVDDPYYNPKQNTYYGCGLYDNEADARKSFG